MAIKCVICHKYITPNMNNPMGSVTVPVAAEQPIKGGNEPFTVPTHVLSTLYVCINIFS
jgi:hypothetical protein